MVPYFCTLIGGFKFLTLILGGISFGLGVYSYDETILQEEYFLRSVQACVIISVIYFAAHLMSQRMVASEFNKAFDIVWHITGAVVLLIGSGLVIYSAVDNQRTYCNILHISHPEHFCQFYRAKLAAGLVTLLNGILYALVAAFVFLDNALSDRKDTKQLPLPPRKGQAYHQYQHQTRNTTIPKCSYYYGERY